MWYQNEHRNIDNRTDNTEIKTGTDIKLIFDKKCKTYNKEKRVSLINGAGKNWHSHVKQQNWKPLTKITSNCMKN